MLKTPIFRQVERTADGYVISCKKPLLYSNFNDCLDRLGVATGFEQKLTSYCFRRGTANAVDGEFQSSLQYEHTLTLHLLFRFRNTSCARSGYAAQPKLGCLQRGIYQ
jgi:hypothetical protein